MNADLKSQLDRAKKLLMELEASAQRDLNKQSVSEETKNLTQETLLKMIRLFDQGWRAIFSKFYEPFLVQDEARKIKIYFPLVSKLSDLQATLGRCKMLDLEADHPEIYKWLESIQPYQDGQNWIALCKKYADESHIRLTPQTTTETKRVHISSGGGSVSWGESVTFGSGVSVMGVPIDPRTQLPVPHDSVRTEIQRWVSFLFEGTDINVLGLCKTAVQEGEKNLEKISSFL